MIFPDSLTLDGLNEFNQGCMVSHVDIEFTEIGKDYLVAKMPVSEKTKQPLGLLHGGATVTLAETLGSVAASVIVQQQNKTAVGLEINANHIKSARSGFVHGKVTPIHIGRSSHVWHIEVKNDQNELVAISRITMAILDMKA